MDYLWLKVFHLIVVVTWLSGMVAVAILLSAYGSHPPHSATSLLEPVRKWDRRVTTPAMILAWVLGISLAVRGHWFPQSWLIAKLIFVFLLSGLHGMLVGRLRRLHWDQSVHPLSGLFTPTVYIALIASIITALVIIKP